MGENKYKPGHVANGHVLTQDGQWMPHRIMTDDRRTRVTPAAKAATAKIRPSPQGVGGELVRHLLAARRALGNRCVGRPRHGHRRCRGDRRGPRHRHRLGTRHRLPQHHPQGAVSNRGDTRHALTEEAVSACPGCRRQRHGAPRRVRGRRPAQASTTTARSLM